MGVEYTHGIFVANLAWTPTWQHVEGAHDVLSHHGFERAEDTPFFALANGTAEVISETDARKMPPNLMVLYEALEGKAAVRVIGPSIYPALEDADRYIMGTQLIFGSDFKALQAEGFEVTVTTELEQLEWHEAMPAFTDVYPATWDAPHPTTDSTPGGFNGLWRCGIVLDCHKDIPAIADGRRPLPCTLVKELEVMFDTHLIEVGWYH